MAKGFGLGRGLDALIDTEHVITNGSSSINEVELSAITPNPNQPRTHFDEEALDELATSIRELGVISPITLRKNEDGSYQIIAGERRYRAAKMVGLKTIPAYIKTAADEQVMEMALIENIQREDLNAIEIALTYQRLMDEYSLTQERMSQRVGKKRATIANYLRLLRLPAEIQMGITEHKIDMGHARALLGTDSPTDQLDIYKRILNEGLSVRKVEEIVRSGNGTARPQAKTENQVSKLPEYSRLQNQLSTLFETKVQFSCNDKGKGKISIPFANDEELSRIMEKLDTINNRR